MEKRKYKHKQSHLGESNRQLQCLATLAPFFQELMKQYHDVHWLSSHPVQFVHRYVDERDQEVVAFIAACFAYGRVSLVLRAIEAVLKPMGAHPADFIQKFDGHQYWSGFYHRFHTEKHLLVLISIIKMALNEYGSLGEMFRQNSLDRTTEGVLHGAVGWLREKAFEKSEQLGVSSDLNSGLKFFFNLPRDGSACKRMTMFLRWMVRKDSIDLGLWSWMQPGELIIPTDTHVGRISYYLRLREGKELQAPSWKMAKEITNSLKQLNPIDPTCYDFALSRLGILDICRRKYFKSVCERCPLKPVCRFKEGKP